MIEEYLIQCYTPKLVAAQNRLANFLTENGYRTTLVDHTNVSLNDFDLRGKYPVSLDKYLANKLGVPYVQVSRIFNTSGEIIDRTVVLPHDLPKDICIIDTDMVTGETINVALNILKANTYSVLLDLDQSQELIDIEDLIFKNSLLSERDYLRSFEFDIKNSFTNISYLLNSKFFEERTSIPKTFFNEVVNVLWTFQSKNDKDISHMIDGLAWCKENLEYYEWQMISGGFRFLDEETLIKFKLSI